jgi:mannan endo-1,4-beta-mannosidase
VSHLINHRNSATGVLYRDDPTILSWELVNEPFCGTDSDNPLRSTTAGSATSPDCSAERLTTWANEMSTYIKSLDPNHLVSVGDSGFLNRPPRPEIEYSNVYGDDFEALLALPGIDFGTFHLYIDYPGPLDTHTPSWGVQYIADHVAAAAPFGKPVVMEEFGYDVDANRRDAIFQLWTDAAFDQGISGWLVWDVPGHQPNGTPWQPWPYDIPYPSATANLLSNAARKMNRP